LNNVYHHNLHLDIWTGTFLIALLMEGLTHELNQELEVALSKANVIRKV